MESPRRSPRLAKRPVTFEVEPHPYKDMIETKRNVEVAAPNTNQKTMCVMTVIILGIWAGFFGSLALQEWKAGRDLFSWETNIYP